MASENVSVSQPACAPSGEDSSSFDSLSSIKRSNDLFCVCTCFFMVDEAVVIDKKFIKSHLIVFLSKAFFKRLEKKAYCQFISIDSELDALDRSENSFYLARRESVAVFAWLQCQIGENGKRIARCASLQLCIVSRDWMQEMVSNNPPQLDVSFHDIPKNLNGLEHYAGQTKTLDEFFEKLESEKLG